MNCSDTGRDLGLIKLCARSQLHSSASDLILEIVVWPTEEERLYALNKLHRRIFRFCFGGMPNI